MIVVNFFAGPGAGKSTLAAGLFAELKLDGENAELVCEFAKDLTWEGRWDALKMAPYVFGEQYYRLRRLKAKVDIVVTDSPLLLSTVYQPTPGFKQFVRDHVEEFRNINVFVERRKPYARIGRSQTQEQAENLDGIILNAITDYYGPGASVYRATGDRAGLAEVTRVVKEGLRFHRSAASVTAQEVQPQ